MTMRMRPKVLLRHRAVLVSLGVEQVADLLSEIEPVEQ